MSKLKVKYVCSSCGYESLKWVGKCPECDEWNTFSEELVDVKKSSSVLTSILNIVKLDEIVETEEKRIQTNISEFDRVLGGGFMQGSVVLIGGDPG
ncbi:MAG: DNA repair protein RadA, partial [Ignavibacteriales bacterium CG18_big_fil_WC_8_21_14_2_50_31_20]